VATGVTVGKSWERIEMEYEGVEILLIEDNKSHEILTPNAFKTHGIASAVYVARDGLEALDYIFSDRAIENPILILLDLDLPFVDGIEVLRQIRSDPRTRLIPVVVLTMSDEQRDIVESYNLGVNSYIVKPVNTEKLDVIARQLGDYWFVLNRQPASVEPADARA
jgi:two-component system response regulator